MIRVLAPCSDKLELRKKQCAAKHSYETRKKARTAAEKAGASVGVKMTFYRCPFCDLFHITKRENRGRGKASCNPVMP